MKRKCSAKRTYRIKHASNSMIKSWSWSCSRSMRLDEKLIWFGRSEEPFYINWKKRKREKEESGRGRRRKEAMTTNDRKTISNRLFALTLSLRHLPDFLQLKHKIKRWINVNPHLANEFLNDLRRALHLTDQDFQMTMSAWVSLMNTYASFFSLSLLSVRCAWRHHSTV